MSDRLIVVTLLLCLVSFLTAQEGPDIDTVLLTNGHRLQGQVTEACEQGVSLLQDHGHIRLPRRLVRRVELGFHSRRALLDESDYEAILDLARWAKDRRMLQQAEELARLALTLGTQDGRAALIIARILDSQAGRQRDAMEYYRLYRDSPSGNDQESLQRLATLEQHFRDFEEQLAAHRQLIERAQDAHEDGLEARPGWQGDDPQHANPIQVNQRQLEDQGIINTVLEVRYLAGDQHKASLRRRVTFDATRFDSISFDVCNPESVPIAVSIAVKTGPDYVYYESPTVTVPPTGSNWHRVSFDMTAGDWKSAASNWAHSNVLSRPDNVRELQIQFHNRRRQGSAFIDQIPLFGHQR